MSIADILKSRPAVGEKSADVSKPARRPTAASKAKADRKPRSSLRTYTEIAPESVAGYDKRLEYEDAERECLRLARRICQARMPDVCMVKAVTAHHVRSRAQGGGNELSNLLAVCRPCHKALHNSPALAAKLGHTKRRDGKWASTAAAGKAQAGPRAAREARPAAAVHTPGPVPVVRSGGGVPVTTSARSAGASAAAPDVVDAEYVPVRGLSAGTPGRAGAN